MAERGRAQLETNRKKKVISRMNHESPLDPCPDFPHLPDVIFFFIIPFILLFCTPFLNLGLGQIWDLRMYRETHAYFTARPVTSMDISQRGLLAVGFGCHLQVSDTPGVSLLMGSGIRGFRDFGDFGDFGDSGIRGRVRLIGRRRRGRSRPDP